MWGLVVLSHLLFPVVALSPAEVSRCCFFFVLFPDYNLTFLLPSPVFVCLKQEQSLN